MGVRVSSKQGRQSQEQEVPAVAEERVILTFRILQQGMPDALSSGAKLERLDILSGGYCHHPCLSCWACFRGGANIHPGADSPPGFLDQ